MIIKKLTLFILGFIPLVLGFMMNSWILENQESVLPFKLIGFVFLAFWVIVGFIGFKFERTLLKSVVIAHLPALLALLLIMYQIISGQLWSNVFLAAQFYYLPLMNISAAVDGIFSFLLSWDNGLGLASITAFLLMFAAYYVGYSLNKHLTIQ